MRACSFTLLILASVISTAAADDWPQFRGPGGEGHSAAKDLPLVWSESENVVWKVAVEGCGWSSPVVLGEQIWMTTSLETPTTPDEAKEMLGQLSVVVHGARVARSVILKAVCVDRATGRRLHDVTVLKIDEPLQVTDVNSFASPTPVVEPGRLYCDFGTMGTVCLDTDTGKILWRRRLPIEHQVGPGSSPILHDNLLVLVRDGCDVQYVTALDKNTGQTVWKTDRPPLDAKYTPYRKSFSTPLMIDVAGRKQMIILGAQWIVSYQPDSGQPIWRADTGSTFSSTARPVFGHGMVYLCTAFGGSQLLAVGVDGQGDVTDSQVAWIGRKQVPKISSPLLVGDQLYMVSDGGVATCLDARTGEIHWSERFKGNYSASPVLADGRIYFFSESGTTIIVRPGKQFEQLAENNLDGRIKASAALVDRSMFLRTDSHLYRIEKK